MGALPGGRFIDRYERRRHASGLRKPLAIAAGVLFIAIGTVMIVMPGPGILVMLFGAMLIAGESRRAALARDRIEAGLRASLARARR